MNNLILNDDNISLVRICIVIIYYIGFLCYFIFILKLKLSIYLMKIKVKIFYVEIDN